MDLDFWSFNNDTDVSLFNNDTDVSLFNNDTDVSLFNKTAIGWFTPLNSFPPYTLLIIAVFLSIILVPILTNSTKMCQSSFELLDRRNILKRKTNELEGVKITASTCCGSINNGTTPAKGRILGQMIVKLDEFDSMTPLIVTNFDHSSNYDSLNRPILSKSPPPQKHSMLGKTIIVPWNSRRPQRMQTLLPYSRGSSIFNTSTNKTIATIVEDPEEYGSSVILPSPGSIEPGYGHFFADLDLISIDRTSISTSFESRIASTWLSNGFSNFPNPVSLSEIAPPSYRPPPPPKNDIDSNFICNPPLSSESNLDRVHKNGQLGVISNEDSTLSSPSESSRGPRSESSFDCTDSFAGLSDSFYLTSESDSTSDTRGRVMDYGLHQRQINSNNASSLSESEDIFTLDFDQNSQKQRHQLHRIEEEEEGGNLLNGENDLQNSDTFRVNSESKLLIPRSISEQFEQIERQRWINESTIC